ncbi:putative sieve element occlusion [Helianthus debilis subsp. tardiflorus]
MLHSKLQNGKALGEDPLLKEINVMLTYDENGKGWAVISHGSNDWMIRVDGDIILTSFMSYDEWKDPVKENRFLPALNGQLAANKPPHHCNRLILAGTTGSVPDTVV